jgi:hypothetical protein
MPYLKPLTIVCDRCEEGTRWTSRYGGNDPDVWPVGLCEACDGTGTRELCCELCGDYGATEFIGRWPFHAECAEEQRADALWMSENVA